MSDKRIARGELLRTKREQLNLTQQQVADAAHVTQQTYAAIELGQTKQPRKATLKAIGKKLMIPIEQLLLDDEEASGLSEEAILVAKTYDRLSQNGKLQVMQTMLRAKGVEERDPVSER
ncbi:MAG TPA: helix-turn-helix transcriptional regulator [Candidatus Competibacter sp.]|nr:helix-turn-helix transcriptional regulator [Candidatus Competibacter sp.]